MKLKNVSIVLIATFSFCISFGQVRNTIPYLDKKDGVTQLIVHQKPFLIFGGELGNSTASNPAMMQPMWNKFNTMNLNTVLVPVYWELIEPQESKFDFSTVDSIITSARRHNLKVVFLWFGLWKNSMSCYVPEWVKANSTRYQRTQDKDGKSQEILSAFNRENLEADKKAFVSLMRHIKEVDSKENTVLMIQVENEIGMLSTAREKSKVADNYFYKQVPAELTDYLSTNKNQLVPEFKSVWDKEGNKLNGNWEDLFGKSVYTDEIFQAWYYAKYTNEIASAGKKEYDLPMYVNAALPRKGKLPGDYPSAGPLPHLMDMWQAAAPAIDILSPDFYNPDTKYWCDLYTRNGNSLFVPEMKLETSCAAKVFFIIGHYKALGFSPFSIENANPEVVKALGKSYNLINQLSELYLSKKWLNCEGVLIDKGDDAQKIKMGNYLVKIEHDNKLPWSPGSKDSTWPSSGAMIFQTGEKEFVVAGTGVVVTFENIDQNQITNFISVDEIEIANSKEKKLSRLNGDENHQGRHVRIAVGDWQIQKIKLYNSPVKID